MAIGFVRDTPAFNRVLYVTNAEDDQWFIPTTGRGDNANSGTMAQRLTQCQRMVGTITNDDGDEVQLGQAVQAGSLADW